MKTHVRLLGLKGVMKLKPYRKL